MFRCVIDADNKRPLLVNVWNNLTGWLSEHERLQLVITPVKSARTIEQNKRLWKIYNELSMGVWVDGKQFGADVWHEYFKRRFLGCDDLILPDGTQSTITHSTTKLNTQEMAEYQNQIQAWAAVEHGMEWDF